MIEVSILIPTTDNAGNPIPSYVAFEDELIARFNGFSLLSATVAGRWADKGQVYDDASRVYMVSLSSIGEGGEVKEVVEFAKREFGQIAIYIRYLGVSEII